MADLINLDELAKAIVERLNDKGVLAPKLMGLESAAAYLGMTPDALKHKALSGKIPSVKIDAKWRFDRDDLDRWINEHKRVA